LSAALIMVSSYWSVIKAGAKGFTIPTLFGAAAPYE
jgi:hypothetical protein